MIILESVYVVISALFIVLVLVIIYYSKKISQLSRALLEAQRRNEELTKMLTDLQLNLSQHADRIAQQRFNEWVAQYSQQLRQQLEDAAKKQYEAQFEMWKQMYEETIRRDAIKRSVNTLLGRIGEVLAPFFLAKRLQVNLRDLRHIGSPVDYIAFKGLSDDDVEPEIIFVEVKTGKSTALSERERKVRDAVLKRRVRYEVISLNELVGEAQGIIEEEIDKLVNTTQKAQLGG